MIPQSAVSDERLRELIAKGPIIPGGVGDAIAALRELQQRRLAMRGVDAGTHVVVPREPTEDMVDAGCDQYDGASLMHSNARCIYRAMLEASRE